MRHCQEGQLFFIRPNTFFSADHKTEFSFDITHLNTTDTASIKMTVYESTLVNVDSVAILCDGQRYICNTPMSIYKEKEKKHWVHRCDCVFPYKEIKLAMIADEAAIGMINNKTTAVRVIPAIGKNVGDTVEFGGLLGYAPVMNINKNSCADFINRGGRIPAPIHSNKN